MRVSYQTELATAEVKGDMTSSEWYRVVEVEPGVTMIEEPWHDEQVKSYLITGTKRALLLDTGTGVGDLRQVVQSITTMPLMVVQSHAHWDHIGSTFQFAGTSEVLVHPEAADELRAGVSNQRMREYLAPEHFTGPFAGSRAGDVAEIPGVEPTGFLSHDQVIDLGGRALRVLDAPGHTAGQVTLWDAANRILFGTDAVYAGPLYAQMDDSDLADYAETLELLSRLEPAPRVVYSAHCEAPMDPGLIPQMREAIHRVLAGRAPDRGADGEAVHEFGGFSILVPMPPLSEGRA